ncbi:MAG TPA: TssQ family T6SS-associated lipoprotein [Casimicrobiaceae bacterium]|nr:TssQ family T6SS-associated lipoprotein [Casimicrobiaceae bacterium]
MLAWRRMKLVSALLCAACAGCAAPPPAERPVAPTPAPAPEAMPAPPPPPAAGPPAQTSPAAAPAPSKAESELALGIESYDDGQYKLATRHLQSALAAGLESKHDQAKAHKYLAFIVCVSGREKACRDHFRKALEADPEFRLEPAEAGNPVWSGALKRVKAQRARTKPK